MTSLIQPLSKKLSSYKERINTELETLITDQDTPYQKIFEATRYSLLAPGKRLRGSLLLAAVEAFGEETQKAIWPACAIEMVHTYSLIHDDLPCMDDDDLRRGRPTLHKAYPEWLALLSGDYLLTKAFETLANAPGVDPAVKISLIQILSSRSGAHGMIGGQVMDILQESSQVPLSQIELTHQLKTAALIETPCAFAARICQKDQDTISRLQGYGQKIGLAFQIVDDILDVKGNSETLGKPAGSDISNAKSTYVSQLGLDESMKVAKTLVERALSELEPLKLQNETLQELARYVIERIN